VAPPAVVFGGEAGMEHQCAVFRQAFAPSRRLEIEDEVLVHRTHGIDGLARNHMHPPGSCSTDISPWGVRVDSKYLKRRTLAFPRQRVERRIKEQELGEAWAPFRKNVDWNVPSG